MTETSTPSLEAIPAAPPAGSGVGAAPGQTQAASARREPAAPAAPAVSIEAPRFEFTGSGGEYFRIWVVNLLLTITTLGVYSAWAKVRRLQYFYRNTRVDGDIFDYHGNPKAILKGRLLALGLLVAYKLAAGLSTFAALAVGLILVAIMPWLLSRAFRFKLANSSYRGLRFRFHGTVAQAYRMPVRVRFSRSMPSRWRWRRSAASPSRSSVS